MPRVLIPLAQGCEELEAVTLIDLLRRADIEVITAGLDDQPIIASRGTCLIPDTTLDTLINQEFIMIVLPGGASGAANLNLDSRIQVLLKNTVLQGNKVAAICAAPTVLANIGLLDGKKATGYPGFLDKLSLPTTTLCNDPVVIDDNVITARGPGAAIDFALALIEILINKSKRLEVEEGLKRSL
ncbi:DJ-1 family glyoxalase III [Candidatus Nitrosacidococcus tergens]|uniref:Chaperone protein YajL n=1 Tax=Candidatus Nitrosacidococcus tergens TaxID=553981 RepID=A0A7G1Q7L2_9GAMM|nr:DJ-1 family glyoxalase III [Candidatus Nitrosacidococcus tergens]CAB1274119.1 Chaperone protein YajL [Candidatus Nitrosacidococcus tergens]